MTVMNLKNSRICRAELIEETFTLEFLTGRGDLSSWHETIRAATGNGGYLVQERIYSPDGSAAPAAQERTSRDRMRCCDPLVLVSHISLPPQYSGVVARPVEGQAVAARKSGGFLLSAGDSRLFFGSPVIVEERPGSNPYQEFFGRLGSQAEASGMNRSDLVRTWIYPGNIDRDYTSINAARKEYFSAFLTGGRLPTSTAVQGRTFPSGRVAGQAWSVSGLDVRSETVASPLQFEPVEYGVLFSRAVALRLRLNSLLLISGTAAIDQRGRSLHGDDCAAQLAYTAEVIRTVLESQGATTEDILQAVIYVKNPRDLELCLETSIRCGFPAERCIIQLADICRSDLLCEIEALAAGPNLP